MKQNDKCECESLRKDNTCHFDFEKCQHINNWKSCVRYNKSHSQNNDYDSFCVTCGKHHGNNTKKSLSHHVWMKHNMTIKEMKRK